MECSGRAAAHCATLQLSSLHLSAFLLHYRFCRDTLQSLPPFTLPLHASSVVYVYFYRNTSSSQTMVALHFSLFDLVLHCSLHHCTTALDTLYPPSQVESTASTTHHILSQLLPLIRLLNLSFIQLPATMRSILVVVLLLSLALSASAGGARFPTFSSTSPLESKTLPAKFEELPEETLPTKQLEDVINKQYVDQEIKVRGSSTPTLRCPHTHSAAAQHTNPTAAAATVAECSLSLSAVHSNPSSSTSP